MSLEKEKLKLQIIKVDAAKAEMVFKILEKKEDIKRLQLNIDNQDKTIEELNKTLKAMEA